MDIAAWANLPNTIAEFERDGLITRTFRRLDAQRQQTIISAILDEAIEKGPTDLNIKLVAERAGVSVGSLYTYFVNRDGLLAFAVALCVRFMSDMFESFRPYLVDVPLVEGLKLYVSGGIEWSKTQAGLIKFFARAAYHSDSELTEQVVRPVATIMRGIVYEMLEKAKARGEIRSDVDLDATARLIHALTIAFGDSQLLPYLNTYFQVVDETIPPERMLNAFVSLVMEGIGTTTTT